MRTVSGRRLPPNIGRENIAVYTGRSLSGREMEVSMIALFDGAPSTLFEGVPSSHSHTL